jgi:mono/diheme cytochrome c family protein
MKNQLIVFIIYLFLSFGFFSCASSEVKNEATTASTIKVDGKMIYSERCVACHGKDGKLGFAGAKDLTKSVYKLNEIIHQVTNGKGAMTPFKNILSAEEILAVSEYTLMLKNK